MNYVLFIFFTTYTNIKNLNINEKRYCDKKIYIIIYK